jgi:hypothetical protein
MPNVHKVLVQWYLRPSKINLLLKNGPKFFLLSEPVAAKNLFDLF